MTVKQLSVVRVVAYRAALCAIALACCSLLGCVTIPAVPHPCLKAYDEPSLPRDNTAVLFVLPPCELRTINDREIPCAFSFIELSSGPVTVTTHRNQSSGRPILVAGVGLFMEKTFNAKPQHAYILRVVTHTKTVSYHPKSELIARELDLIEIKPDDPRHDKWWNQALENRATGGTREFDGKSVESTPQR